MLTRFERLYNPHMALELMFLGTGTSAGIPMIGCDGGACGSEDPRDRRDRASALIRWPDPDWPHHDEKHAEAAAFNPAQAGHRQVLIDASPDLRYQAIRARLSRLDAVMYTHAHADHIFGTDDLRRFNAVMQAPLDIYADAETLGTLRRMFAYIFEPERNVNQSFVASLIPREIEAGDAWTLHGASWTAVRLLHGRLPILGFRIEHGGCSVGYCTDMSTLPPESYEPLTGLDVVVVDALRHRHHPTHQTLDRACELAAELGAKRTFFTHMGHEVTHAKVDPELPDGVSLACDGLSVKVNSDGTIEETGDTHEGPARERAAHGVSGDP